MKLNEPRYDSGYSNVEADETAPPTARSSKVWPR